MLKDPVGGVRLQVALAWTLLSGTAEGGVLVASAPLFSGPLFWTTPPYISPVMGKVLANLCILSASIEWPNCRYDL